MRWWYVSNYKTGNLVIITLSLFLHVVRVADVIYIYIWKRGGWSTNKMREDKEKKVQKTYDTLGRLEVLN